METCKVEFTHENGQKIIICFDLEDNGSLEYKPFFDPKIVDPKTNLGLAGQLCEILLEALSKYDKSENTSIKDGKQKRKLKS
ncbi:hypothetical protein [Clostridium sp.]|uniref:hypothetical protein n=1 Tax=Clostridium sp. TaxID=1506 RepID=UPI002FC63F67